uniref:OSJNBa0027O01.9 protein n=1 Tax=Oryza sativa subsp. japonica TaxID=39947 RepID=Q7XXC2_ORYSJ|nr:OSJNBa0027O01.9 [Oryza sativa Japonica Group]
MARGSALLDGSVLPPSRIVSERQAGLSRRFMPESATGREIVTLGEGRPAPDYPGRSVFFLPFAMAGLVPPFSSFFMDVLEFYDLQMAHLTPNAVMTLAIFAHLCEMFIGVRPSLRLFRWFFTVQSVSPPSVVGGCYFQPRGPVLNRYIPCALRKKWDDWKSDWFYTPLADEARLRLPSQPPAQASSWRAPVDLGDGYDAVLDRLAGLRSQGLTGAMVYGDYLRRRIAPLQRRARGAWEYTGSEDFTRTHQGVRWDWAPEDFKILTSRYWSNGDPDRASILTIMMAVGASEERAPKGHDGAGGSRRGEQSTPRGGRASGSRDRGPGSSRPADARGKRNPRGSARRSGPVRWGRQNHLGETSFPLQSGRLTDPLAARSRRVPPAIPSPASLRPRIRRPQRPSGGNLTGERPRIAYGKPRRPPGLARPRKPLGRRPPGPARPGKPLGRRPDFARTRRWRLPRQLATRPRARRLGPLPQATTSGAAGDEAAGASLGPTPSGDAQDQPGPGDIPESGTSIGGPSRVASSPRRLFPTPSIALLNAEPLLQALAAANTTVLDGLSAQVEVLQAERAELDAAWARVEEGRRSVEAMVEVRRLQYGSWEAELGKKLDAAQGVLDAAAAREQRAAETEAASRRREEALEARAMALEERACVVERDLADREAAVTIREATLAAHEAACAEEEFTLRLREDALTKRERALEGAEAAAQQLAVNLSLREAAQEEQARRNLEGARAERAVLNQRAAELEARAKELDARARSGGAATGESDLAARLAAAERTIADLQGALDSSAGEVEALRLAGEVGPGMLWDAVSRLDCAGRQVGLWRGRTVKYAANQGGLAQCLSKMAGALQRLPEELEKTIKSSSRDLAQGAVELVLASYQARDPNFSPWMALDEFPPGTEDRARAQVRDAADHIVDSFEGSAPRLAFAPNSDEEGNAGGADDSDVEAGDPGASD